MICGFASFSTTIHQNLAILKMKPKKNIQKSHQMELFRPELIKIINPGHEMVKLANVVDWDRLDELFGETYCPDNGRPGISTRLMVSLHYLKYTFNLSDEDAVDGWVENPYWQYLSGMKYFEHEAPIDPSSMTNWRKRIGQAGAEELLKETINAGLKTKAVKNSQLKRVNVDTTVQENRIAKESLHVFVDRGYRGHDYRGSAEVHVDKIRRGGTSKSPWRWMKRRAAVEPGIGHLKREHRMDRNRLKGTEGDRVNAILSAAGMNFRKLLKRAAHFFGFILSKIITALRPKFRLCCDPI
jgi:hypothetical protein